VQEFRVSPQAALGRERTIQMVLWSSIPALVGATFFGLYAALFSRHWVSTIFTYLAITIVAATIGGAYYAAVLLGMERVKQKTILVLTDSELVRRREGWPDVRIGFSEIKTLYQGKSGLVVESAEPRRIIVVTKDIDRFASLRNELSKHAATIKAPSRSPLVFFPTIASVICWALVLISTDVGTVKAAGGLGLATLVWATFRLSRLTLPHRRTRLAVWGMTGFSWVASLWVLYSRIARL
jgi:hypothetical protein